MVNTVLIAGGFGLIGHEILNHLVKQGYAVINYDLTGIDSVMCIDAHKPLHTYLRLDFDIFIDCARYDKPSEQFITWNTVINHFKAQKRGKIILFSSIYGHKAPDFSIYKNTEIKETPIEYAIWKGGIEQATRYLAQKLKPYCVQVNCIAPGGVLNGHSSEFRLRYSVSGGASMITTDNILPVIDMLLHKDNAVNGQVICVDKGWGL